MSILIGQQLSAYMHYCVFAFCKHARMYHEAVRICVLECVKLCGVFQSEKHYEKAAAIFSEIIREHPAYVDGLSA